MNKRPLGLGLGLALAVATVGAAPGRANAIAGGATQTTANYAVSIRVGDAAKGQPIWGCSGARLASDWVITTATCVRESGAAPATNGAAPLKTLTVAASSVTMVAIHPTADVALLRTDDILRLPNASQQIAVAATGPAVGESVKLIGFGRTADEWVAGRHVADFQVQSATDATATAAPIGAGVVCKGDAGGPAVRDSAGRAELVGLIGAAAQGGCLGSTSTTDHNATVVRVDGLEPWVKSWTLSTGFESTDPASSENVGAYGSASTVGVVGVCCSLAGPELSVRAERPHTGTNVLMYSGKDTSATKSFAYMKAYAAPSLPVTSSTLLSYWIWPQSTSPASGSNSSCVAVDLDFSDGKRLRDLKAYATNGATDSHPARQCGHLTMNTWNHVTVDVGEVATGKKITQVNVGYDQPANTGGYRGLVDDIVVYQGCLGHGGKVCAHSTAAQATARAANAGSAEPQLNFDEPIESSRESAVENFSYPNAAEILENQKIKVISGNGGLMLADCATPPTGAYGYIRVRSSNPDVGSGGQICLRALGNNVGLINLEVPEVFSIRSDGLAAGEGHPTKATWRVGAGAPQSGAVPAGGILPIGIGTDDNSPPATLLQILVNGS